MRLVHERRGGGESGQAAVANQNSGGKSRTGSGGGSGQAAVADQGSLPTPATTAAFSASAGPSGHWCTHTRPGGTRAAVPKNRRIWSRVRPVAVATSVRR